MVGQMIKRFMLKISINTCFSHNETNKTRLTTVLPYFSDRSCNKAVHYKHIDKANVTDSILCENFINTALSANVTLVYYTSR